MKYVCFIYQPKDFDPKALSEAQYKEVAAAYAALTETPSMKPGLPVGLPQDAVTVRVADGRPEASPGPYVPGGTVGGYFEFEAETQDEAVRFAARVPAAQLGGAVEVRPAQPYW